jgi:hypothetical protein
VVERRQRLPHAHERLASGGLARRPTPPTGSKRDVSAGHPLTRSPAPLSSGGGDLVAAFVRVARVLGSGEFTAAIAGLERGLADADRAAASDRTLNAGFDPDLLTSALLVRQHVGRINDLVHAATR